MIPANPCTLSELNTDCVTADGISIILLGGFVDVYPNPGSVIVTEEIVPPAETVAVAIAVVPTPTPICLGAAIATGRDDPVYPRPGFTTVIALTVPPEETDTENSAAVDLPHLQQ